MTTMYHLTVKKVLIGMVVCALGAPVYAKDIVATYQKTCGACHDSGALGAPKKGDKATWDRLKAQKGMDALVRATRQGMPQMPAMGLCQSCSDKDFRELIDHMSK
ncbi:MAG: c-type cytochrome [Moraxella sp.]|nr:c-type cytochrome [Moraxella sp.]